MKKNTIKPLNHLNIPNVCCIILGTSLLVACDSVEQKNEAKSAAPPPALVEVVKAEQKDIPVSREWIGSLDGFVNVSVLAQVSGYLIKRNYSEGLPVKKGDMLYEIDPRVYQAALEQAKSNLARQQAVLRTAQLDLNRVKRLLPERAISVRERDNAVGQADSAKAEVLAAEAAVKKAKLDLGFTRIHSPINGIPGLSKAQLGDLVGPGSASSLLTTVSQVDPIKAVIPISEQEYLKFERDKVEGQNVELRLFLADGSEYPFPGKYLASDRQIDLKSGTIQVTITFPNSQYLLRPGQYARVTAEIGSTASAIVIPQRAIIDLQGKSMLAVVKPDNTVNIREVKLGQVRDNQLIVESGLTVGEQVIVSGIQKVREGMKVQPKPAESEPSASPVSKEASQPATEQGN